MYIFCTNIVKSIKKFIVFHVSNHHILSGRAVVVLNFITIFSFKKCYVMNILKVKNIYMLINN